MVGSVCYTTHLPLLKIPAHPYFRLSSSHAGHTCHIISGYRAGFIRRKYIKRNYYTDLITCLVASFVTEKAARKIVLREKNEDTLPESALPSGNILILLQLSNIPSLLDFSILLKRRNPITPLPF